MILFTRVFPFQAKLGAVELVSYGTAQCSIKESALPVPALPVLYPAGFSLVLRGIVLVEP